MPPLAHPLSWSFVCAISEFDLSITNLADWKLGRNLGGFRCAEQVFHPNLPELYRKKVTKLQQALKHEATRPQVFETIRSLVDRIEALPGRARGHAEVTVVGALAQILAFAQQKTTAASTRGGGTSLMVAGVGFEPTTFRL